MSESRTRTITWSDPGVYAAAGALSGLEVLQRILDGRLPRPPIAELLGLRGIEVARGRVLFEMEIGEYHYNPLNVVHGGATATLLDTVLGCAVQTLLPAGGGYTTTDLHVRFVRPATLASGTLRAEGTVVHSGSRLATAEARVHDSASKLLAHATCGCLIFPPSPRR